MEVLQPRNSEEKPSSMPCPYCSVRVSLRFARDVFKVLTFSIILGSTNGASQVQGRSDLTTKLTKNQMVFKWFQSKSKVLSHKWITLACFQLSVELHQLEDSLLKASENLVWHWFRVHLRLHLWEACLTKHFAQLILACLPRLHRRTSISGSKGVVWQKWAGNFYGVIVGRNQTPTVHESLKSKFHEFELQTSQTERENMLHHCTYINCPEKPNADLPGSWRSSFWSGPSSSHSIIFSSVFLLMFLGRKKIIQHFIIGH